jgi:hypothetical protein
MRDYGGPAKRGPRRSPPRGNRTRTGVFAPGPLAGPLATLTRPVASPRLPADRPARPYRPKISHPKPRRTPPRASRPSRRTPRAPRSWTTLSPLHTLTRPIPQSGSFEAQHMRRLADAYRSDLVRQVRSAQSASGKRGGVAGVSLPFKEKGLTRPYGVKRYSPAVRSNDQLLGDLKFFRLSPSDQRRHVIASAPAPSKGAAGVATAEVLRQLSRPGYASAGAARAAVRGENVPRAALRGVKLKDKYLYGDVLREAGWRPKSALGKTLESAVGSALDIGLDPTTYVSGGTSSLGRKVAASVARDVAKAEARRVLARELAAGTPKAQAKRIARVEGVKAGSRAFEDRMSKATPRERERVPQISLGAGRIKVGTPLTPAVVARRTARGTRQAAARGLERTGPGARVVQQARAKGLKARQIGSELNALVRPAGMTAEQFARSREIGRTKRATAETIARRGQQRAGSLAALSTPAEQKLIRDAIEADDLGRLQGIAEPIRLSPRVLRGRANVKRLAADPDRLLILARHFGDDLTATRERALDAGVPVGYVGVKPPVQIPQVTADVNAAWRDVLKAKTPQQKRAAVAELRRVERDAVAQKTHRRLAEKQAAEREGEAKGYVPRIARERLERRGPLTLEDVVSQPTRRIEGGAKRPRPSKGRTVKAPMAELERRAAEGDQIAQRYISEHSEDLPLIGQAYHAGMGRGIASAEANRTLVAEGRPVVAGRPIHLGEGERVYAHDGADLRELKPKSHADMDELTAVERGDATGNYVVLPRAMVEHVTGTSTHVPGAAGAAWDRVQSYWRRFALGSPSYLMRNLLGDAFAAYGAQNPAALARNYVRGQRGLNEYGRSERAYRWFQSAMDRGGKGTTTTVNGQPIRYRDLALEAEAAGAIKQGRLAEIRDAAASGKPLWQLKVGSSAWSKAVERVEDSARLATYIGARERGLAPEQAAAQVAKVHFDYGELTRLEKQFRRATGFYTFPTRNLPRVAQLLATRPGKLTAAEKTREEFQKTSGLPEDYLAGLDPFEARQMGLPIRFGGKVYTVSAALPFVDLADLEPGSNILYRELGLVSPLAKMPVELLLNASAFYRGPIEDAQAPPRTPVPEFVTPLADRSPEFRRRLGIKRIKVDGKDVWGWHKKLDYGLRQVLPGLFGAAYRASQKPSARGFGPGSELFSVLTGLRAKPYDPKQATRNRLYGRLNKLTARRRELNQAGVYEYNATPEWQRVSAQIRDLTAQLDATAATSAPSRGPSRVRRPPPQLGGTGMAPGRFRRPPPQVVGR